VRYFDLSKATPRTIGLILTIVSLPITNNQIDCFLKAIINTLKMMMSYHPIFGDDELSPHPFSLVLL
jgi:hypothetical protein